MKRQLVTYEECKKITELNDNFFEKTEVVNGVKISIFNYLLNIQAMFETPFEGADVSAHELRGITFVHEETGIKRYLALHKFFNVGETEGGFLPDLKKKKIVRIQEKLDGSMISFIRVNGKTIIKTKASVGNDQTILANQYFASQPDLQSFVNEALDQGLAPVFELVSPHNVIVINYSTTELRLLQLRDADGKYLDIYAYPLTKKYNILKSKSLPIHSLEELQEMQKTNETDEGWVVTFENPDGSQQMNKFKTEKYFLLHKLLDSVALEDALVNLICNEKLDDAISLLDKENERRQYAEKMQEFLSHHIRKLVDEGKALYSKYNGDRKAFAIENKDNALFGLVVKLINNPFDEEKLVKSIKEYVIKQTARLQMARTYLNKNGFPVQSMITTEEGSNE